MFESLPQEIFEEIIGRLPVKTFLVMRCVCKAWNSVITNDLNFAQFYLHSFKNNTENKFLLSRECKLWKELMFVRHTNTFTKIADLNGSSYLKVGYVDGVLKEQVVVPRTYEDFAYLSTDDCKLVGYVDGVLLIHTYLRVGRIIKFILWNPSIRKVLEIPSPSTALAQKRKIINFGFGYDYVSNEHKVVAVDTKHTKVYRLGTGLWSYPKDMRSYKTIPKLYLKKFSSTTNFEGAIYWLASVDANKREKYSHCLCFDLSSEASSCTELPNVELKEGRKQLPKRCSSVLDKKLAIVDFTNQHVCVWVMEKYGATDYSWTKRYSVDLHIRRFLYLKENGELLFYGKLKQVTSYDFKNQQVKTLERQHGQIIRFLDTYKESLVLLGGINKGSTDMKRVRETP